MSLLIYCVLNGRRGPARPSVRGVDKRPVWVLECGGLCAAVAEVAAELEGGAAQLNELLAYARTVEAFGRRETVVPMRYGCRLETIKEVRAWVAGRRAELRGLLDRFEGCVEMGVRILPARGSPAPPAGGDPAARAAAGAARNAGAAYLAARRRQLAVANRLERTACDVRGALGALAREVIMETAAPGQPTMVSLYFLIAKTAMSGFRAAFARAAAASDTAMLLSGPWPPYNFVSGSQAGDTFAQRVIAPASMPYASHDESGHGATVTS